MPAAQLYSSLTTSHPHNYNEAPAIFQSVIDLLEFELVKARMALHGLQPDITAAYRDSLIARTPSFFYGSRHLTLKEIGLIPAAHEARVDDNGRVDSDLSSRGVANAPLFTSPRATTLVDLLSNTLILDRIAPYLSVQSLLCLASTSRFFRFIVFNTAYVFRHLDLTEYHNTRLSNTASLVNSGDVYEGRIDDESYSAPLKGIFANLWQQGILRDVRTLVLDGLSVTTSIIAEIILTSRFNVNILSIRDCFHQDERKLMQIFQHAVRPTRPAGTPRVRGVYYFTPTKSGPISRAGYRDWWDTGHAERRHLNKASVDGKRATPPDQVAPPYCQNAWYRPSGKLLKENIGDGWAQTIKRCEGIIAFDAVLCRGPRHNIDPYSSAAQDMPPSSRMFGPTIATIAVGPSGCYSCHGIPEGPATWGHSPDEYFPLLAPPPLHTSTLAAAKRPVLFPNRNPALVVRCADCLTDRWCHRCNKWFCEICVPHPDRPGLRLSLHQTAVRGRDSLSGGASSGRIRLEYGVSKDCWECGPTCAACKIDSQRICQNCQGGYCVEHNEGCSSEMCDWCNTSARHRMKDCH